MKRVLEITEAIKEISGKFESYVERCVHDAENGIIAKGSFDAKDGEFTVIITDSKTDYDLKFLTFKNGKVTNDKTNLPNNTVQVILKAIIDELFLKEN